MPADKSDIIEQELERPRGILTESDRALLLNHTEELTDRARTQRLVRLRRRVRNALMDGALLMNLDPEDRELIFRPRDDDEGQLVRGGAAFLFRFLYVGVKQTGANMEAFVEQNAKQAEKEYAGERGEYIDPNVRFHVSKEPRVDINEAIGKLQDGNPLSGTEVAAIWESNYEPTKDELERLLDHRRSKKDVEDYRTGARESPVSENEDRPGEEN